MVDEKTVKKVAETARISLTSAELNKMSRDLNTILKAFKELDKVVTGKNVKPSFQPLEIKNVTRKDKVTPSLTQKQALANTKQKERGYFKGPRAV
jgi:aspartyl/glutamyl-tRNA(Asn/Gln) amidotransferase C subunit